MDLLLILPPLLANLALFCLFAASLRPGRIALLTRMARLARPGGPLPVLVQSYSRRLTLVWACLFLSVALLIGSGLVMPALRPLARDVALGQGLFHLAFLLLEFGFRRWHLRQVEQMSLLDFLRFLRQVDYRTLLRD